jgi:hypothetical protein
MLCKELALNLCRPVVDPLWTVEVKRRRSVELTYQNYEYISVCVYFLVRRRAFSFFVCTVPECDGGNRTCTIAVYTWRFSLLSYDRNPLSYGRHPTELRPSPNCYGRSNNWATAVKQLSYGRHPLSYARHPTELRLSPNWATAVTINMFIILYPY